MTSLDPDLGEGPFDDELDTEPLAIPRRRRLPLLTAVLVLGVVAGGAFIGGAEAQKHWGSSGSSGNGGAASSFAARLRGDSGASGSGGANGARGGFGGGGVTVGTVSVIKGSTLYVDDANGNTVKVTTSPTADVTKTVSGSVKTIRPGDTVVVRGTQQRNGDISAESISIGTPGGGGFGSFGGRGGGGATGFGSGNGGGATGFGSGGGSGNSSGGSNGGGATGFGSRSNGGGSGG